LTRRDHACAIVGCELGLDNKHVSNGCRRDPNRQSGWRSRARQTRRTYVRRRAAHACRPIAVGLSRSLFAQRFTSFAGVSPMHNLGGWRMPLPARRLKSGAGRRGARIRIRDGLHPGHFKSSLASRQERGEKRTMRKGLDRRADGFQINDPARFRRGEVGFSRWTPYAPRRAR
jgi:hypothetical protein